MAFLLGFASMIFHITGIKEVWVDKYNINILMDCISNLLTKKILEDLGIIVLSIKEEKKELSSFGKTFITISQNSQEITIATENETLEDTIYQFSRIGFDIINANYFDKKLENSEVNKIITDTKNKIAAEDKAQEDLVAKQEEQQAKAFSDQKLKKVKNIVDKTINEIDELIEKVTGNVSWTQLNKLRKLEEELKKIRLGTNKAKMTEMLEQIFNLVEEINDEYFDFVKDQQKLVVKWSIVTNLNVIKEYDKYKKSLIVKELWISPSKDDNYYIFMAKAGILFRLLGKDIVRSLQNRSTIIRNLYFTIETVLLCIILFLSFTHIVNQSFLKISINQNIMVSMMQIWLLASLTYIVIKFKFKTTQLLLLMIPVLIIVYNILFHILRESFAL